MEEKFTKENFISKILLIKFYFVIFSLLLYPKNAPQICIIYIISKKNSKNC